MMAKDSSNSQSRKPLLVNNVEFGRSLCNKFLRDLGALPARLFNQLVVQAGFLRLFVKRPFCDSHCKPASARLLTSLFSCFARLFISHPSTANCEVAGWHCGVLPGRLLSENRGITIDWTAEVVVVFLRRRRPATSPPWVIYEGGATCLL